jgi:ubiquinone/menaquinone biosynthesis C-methylase UbiE
MAENTTESTNWKADSQSFDDVAERYHAYRPGYPSELIEDIIRLSGIQPDGRILEIGSGTGKATLMFAQKGYSILCLEPGQNLIEVAARNLAAYPQVRFVKARFEEWNSEQLKFDLVISAQAFHWVPEEARYAKTASILKERGYLAAFWNMYPGMEDHEISAALDQVYRQRAPEMVKAPKPMTETTESIANSIRSSGYFKQVVIRKYPWSLRYTTREYLGLLNTYSDHLRLSERKRSRLFDDISEVLDHNGGYIDRPYLSVVYLAQKSACP